MNVTLTELIDPTTNIADPENVAYISLPPSLFELVDDEDVGLVYTFYNSSNLFPLANGTRNNATIGTSVIGALIAAEDVLDLIVPVEIVLPLRDTVRTLILMVYGSMASEQNYLYFRTLSILGVLVGTSMLQV